MAILAKMAYLPKMAEMTLKRQNRQIINKNSNDMAKALWKVAIVAKMAYSLNYKTIDPAEILLSWFIRAAEN